MRKILLSALILLSFQVTQAQDADEDKLTDAQIEQTYIMQCGSIEDVIKVVKAENPDMKGDPSEDDIKELNKSRATMLEIIRDGEPAIQKLLDQSSKDGIGAFGVLLTCGIIDIASDKIKERGCQDLVSKQSIKDGPGIEACKRVMANLKK